MKRYEGLFILNTAGKDEGVPALVDKVTAEISAQGGRIETTQKMDKRQFARTADRKTTSGFYVNIIFSLPPSALETLRARLALNPDVFRFQFSHLPAKAPTPVLSPVAA